MSECELYRNDECPVPQLRTELMKLKDEELRLLRRIEQLIIEKRGLQAALVWSERFDGSILVKDMREFLEALKAGK